MTKVNDAQPVVLGLRRRSSVGVGRRAADATSIRASHYGVATEVGALEVHPSRQVVGRPLLLSEGKPDRWVRKSE